MTEAERILKILGENGERWIKGSMENSNGCMCLVGAFTHETPLDSTDRIEKFKLLSESVKKASGANISAWYSVSLWNDNPQTTWADVRHALNIYHDAELALQLPNPASISPS